MTAERVILIQGDADKWFEQAIFIVKPGTRPGIVPKDMVEEAEQIIAAYLAKNHKPIPAGFPIARGYTSEPPVPAVRETKKRTGRGKNFILNILMILACLALTGVFLFGMIQ